MDFFVSVPSEDSGISKGAAFRSAVFPTRDFRAVSNPGAIAMPAIWAFCVTAVNASAVPKFSIMQGFEYFFHAPVASHRRSVPISLAALSGTVTGIFLYMPLFIRRGFFPVIAVAVLSTRLVSPGTTELIAASVISLFESPSSEINFCISFEKSFSFVAGFDLNLFIRINFSLSATAAFIFVFPMSKISTIQ